MYTKDVFTLNHEQYLQFTGWSKSNYMKQSPVSRIEKLTKMGVQVLTTTGRATNTEYVIHIPYTFWRMFIIQGMKYSDVGVRYIDMIISNNDLSNTEGNVIIQFHNEMMRKLATQLNVEYDAIESTHTRIRRSLNEHGYIRLGGAEDVKTHRIKKNGVWTTGDEAVAYDKRIRAIWSNFFADQDFAYTQSHPGTTEAPRSIYVEEMKQLFLFGMKEKLDADSYRIAKRTFPTQNLINDIHDMKSLFMETMNLELVKAELTRRQTLHKANKKLQTKREAEAQERTVKENHIPKAERQLSKAKMKQVEAMKDYVPLTEDQMKHRENYLDAITFDLVPNQLGGDE